MEFVVWLKVYCLNAVEKEGIIVKIKSQLDLKLWLLF
jgi:hypothetical protein